MESKRYFGIITSFVLHFMHKYTVMENNMHGYYVEISLELMAKYKYHIVGQSEVAKKRILKQHISYVMHM